MAHITRREFLELGAAAGFASVAGAACRTAGVPGALPGLPGPAIPPFALQEATLADLERGLESGKYTAHALCESYLARIDDLDRRGPTLRSIIDINPDALRSADELDAERKTRGPRGPLHGIPILIKDNIATADRMATTAGSFALVGAKPPADAAVAARLRAAGAVLLGKANLSEWANFRSNSSSSGWSARGGQCKNPYVLDRSPCGSSSGTAAAIAANFAALGVELVGARERVGIGLDHGAQHRAAAVQVVDAGQIGLAQRVRRVLAALQPPLQVREGRLLERERGDRRAG